MPREFLGQWRDFGGAIRTYRADGAFEMDEIEGTSGTRRRIFFEDVLLVSFHKERTLLYLLATATVALLFIGLGLSLAAGPSREGAWVLLLFGSPFLIAFLMRLFVPVSVVTIFGRHGRARLQFDFRAGRARAVHQRICREVREAQARLRPRTPPAPLTPPEAPGVEGA